MSTRRDSAETPNTRVDSANSAATLGALERSVAQQLVLSLTLGAKRTEGRPIALLMSGLPGTGKTYVSHWLADRVPAIVVSSDHVRKFMYPAPAYTPDESAIIHCVCRLAMRELLAQGFCVIDDATNLVEAHRRMVYCLADEVGAELLVIRTIASERVVRQRLERRKAGPDDGDLSDADWDVYRMLQVTLDSTFAREVITVDTSCDSLTALECILTAISAKRTPSA